MKVTYSDIYGVIRLIPKGRVATYGQIADLAGLPRQARRVGYALSALPKGTAVPWQRVVNANGEISRRSHGGPDRLQRKLLQLEGVAFERGRIPLDRFQWRPRS
jgi:methylated-DNA-protein-cysteine methyltransferase related protein